jgi:hypothetical protein
MKYINIKFMCSILMLIFLAAYAAGQDDDIFRSDQDQKGNATPVITEKNLPGSIASSQPSQPKARLISPTSTWSLNLLDSLERAVALQMYQSNDVVFGKGTIVMGSGLQNATATGTIAGNKLNLDILSDDLTLFHISLTRNGKSLSGDYHGYSVSYVPWKGIAMGSIEA